MALTIYEKASLSMQGAFKPRIVSAQDLFEHWREQHASLQIKSFYSVIQRMTRLGHLKRARPGFYVNLQAVPAVTDNEIAVYFRKDCVISMHSALYHAGALNNPTRVVTACVPAEVYAKGSMGKGRLGAVHPGHREIMSTQDFDIWQFSVPKEMIDERLKSADHFLIQGLPYLMATKECALVDWIYVGSQRKSYVYRARSGRHATPGAEEDHELALTGLPPLDIDLYKFDKRALIRIARISGVTEDLRDWLEAKMEYDRAVNVMGNMNQQLGF